jgi:hypothetical protein
VTVGTDTFRPCACAIPTAPGTKSFCLSVYIGRSVPAATSDSHPRGRDIIRAREPSAIIEFGGSAQRIFQSRPPRPSFTLRSFAHRPPLGPLSAPSRPPRGPLAISHRPHPGTKRDRQRRRRRPLLRRRRLVLNLHLLLLAALTDGSPEID